MLDERAPGVPVRAGRDAPVAPARRITTSLREVVRTTGVPISTVMGMANNTIRRVPLDELNTLCGYFNCDVGDLLKREEVPA